MHRTWQENTDLVDRFREWLARTDEELDELSGNDRSVGDVFSEDNSRDASRNDSPLKPFTPSGELEDPALGQSLGPTFGWLQLVESFTALRQELKLQTKSARGLDDNVRTALAGLESASRQFQSVQADESRAAERASQPFVEALIGLDESLERCGRALQAIRARAVADGPRLLHAALDERFRKLPAWRRWLLRRWQATVVEICQSESVESQQRLWQGLAEGFDLVANRLRRAMEEQKIHRIPCLGRQVDANQMTVVELVDAPNAPPESVVAELRPGYTWQGKIVRYAEVQAVRQSTANSAASTL